MNKGFTLIELLVVVLIIGILAAVALPQYQKAVEKSRAASALTALDTIYKNYQLCVLDNGAESEKCDLSGIENTNYDFFNQMTIPVGNMIDDCNFHDMSHCIAIPDFEIYIDSNTIYADRTKSNPTGTAIYSFYLNPETGRIRCASPEGNKTVCTSLCGSEYCYVK